MLDIHILLSIPLITAHLNGPTNHEVRNASAAKNKARSARNDWRTSDERRFSAAGEVDSLPEDSLWALSWALGFRFLRLELKNGIIAHWKCTQILIRFVDVGLLPPLLPLLTSPTWNYFSKYSP